MMLIRLLIESYTPFAVSPRSGGSAESCSLDPIISSENALAENQ